MTVYCMIYIYIYILNIIYIYIYHIELYRERSYSEKKLWRLMESLHNILSSFHSDHVALRSQVSLSRRFLAVLVFLLMSQLVLCVYFIFLIYQYIKCLNVADIAF